VYQTETISEIQTINKKHNKSTDPNISEFHFIYEINVGNSDERLNTKSIYI